MRNPERTWVLIPFSSRDDPGSSRGYKDAWADRLRSSSRILTLRNLFKLRDVQDGDTIYIQAHGYSDDFSLLGGRRGRGAINATQLARFLNNSMRQSRTNLRIKVFSCFSGFQFAADLYDELSPRHPGLRVYGYFGETQVTARETRKRVLFIPVSKRVEGNVLQRYLSAIEAGTQPKRVGDASADPNRVVFGNEVAVDSDDDSSGDDA